MRTALKPWPLLQLWLRRHAPRAATRARSCPTPDIALQLAPGQSLWLTLARGEVLHLQRGRLALSPAPRALDGWLALPHQPLRAGEVWVAERAGRVLLQAADRAVALLRRPA